MNWKLKAGVLASLSRIPGGTRIYRSLQHLSGSLRIDADFEVRKSLELVDLIREGGGGIRNRRIVEIGTGWKPFVPFIFSLCGAECVVTFDVNRWLTFRAARQTLKVLDGYLDQLATMFPVQEKQIRHRYREAVAHCTDLNSLLKSLRIDYRCPADFCDSRIPESTCDVILSSNVLEHIPVDILAAMHRESERILRPGGLAVHRCNPEDHFADVDETISSINFLQYSKRRWHWIGGSGLAFHNRLRAVQHRWMLEASGMETVICRYRICERAVKLLQTGGLHLDEDFTGFSTKDLAADYMWSVHRKGSLVCHSSRRTVQWSPDPEVCL